MCDISLGTFITEDGGSGTVGVPGGNSLESVSPNNTRLGEAVRP